jgi:DNA-binding NtrC family response regulator
MVRLMDMAVVLARRQRIEIEDLPPEVGLAVPTAVAATDVKPLAEVERDYIGAVLRAVGGNRSQAAAKLGIGPARQELTGSTRSAPAPGG